MLHQLKELVVVELEEMFMEAQLQRQVVLVVEVQVHRDLQEQELMEQQILEVELVVAEPIMVELVDQV